MTITSELSNFSTKSKLHFPNTIFQLLQKPSERGQDEFVLLLYTPQWECQGDAAAGEHPLLTAVPT